MMVRWLYPQWVGAALCGGILLFLLMPVLAISWSTPLLMIFLQLPVYMVHQVEEHDRDRFRRFVNDIIFGGAEALDPAAVLWINIPGVWGVGLLCLYAADFAGLGWGLALVYLVLVNGITHIVGGIVTRRYNPGLWTAIVLFLPSSVAALAIVNDQPGVTAAQHVVGLLVAILIHVVIVAYTFRRAAHWRLSKSLGSC